MNPDAPLAPLTPREELEIQITALLMGQLPPEEAAALEAKIAADPQLAALHAKLRHAVQLLREARTLPEQTAPATPLQLSKERREKLLAAFRGIKPLPSPQSSPLPSPATLLAPEPPRTKRRDWKWAVPIGLAASFMALFGGSMFYFGRDQVEHARWASTQNRSSDGEGWGVPTQSVDMAAPMDAESAREFKMRIESPADAIAAEPSRPLASPSAHASISLSAASYASQPGAIRNFAEAKPGSTPAYKVYSQAEMASSATPPAPATETAPAHITSGFGNNGKTPDKGSGVYLPPVTLNGGGVVQTSPSAAPMNGGVMTELNAPHIVTNSTSLGVNASHQDVTKFFGGGTAGSSPQTDPVEFALALEDQPVAHGLVTKSGQRSGQLGISSNAIDALLFSREGQALDGAKGQAAAVDREQTVRGNTRTRDKSIKRDVDDDTIRELYAGATRADAGKLAWQGEGREKREMFGEALGSVDQLGTLSDFNDEDRKSDAKGDKTRGELYEYKQRAPEAAYDATRSQAVWEVTKEWQRPYRRFDRSVTEIRSGRDTSGTSEPALEQLNAQQPQGGEFQRFPVKKDSLDAKNKSLFAMEVVEPQAKNNFGDGLTDSFQTKSDPQSAEKTLGEKSDVAGLVTDGVGISASGSEPEGDRVSGALGYNYSQPYSVAGKVNSQNEIKPFGYLSKQPIANPEGAAVANGTVTGLHFRAGDKNSSLDYGTVPLGTQSESSAYDFDTGLSRMSDNALKVKNLSESTRGIIIPSEPPVSAATSSLKGLSGEAKPANTRTTKEVEEDFIAAEGYKKLGRNNLAPAQEQGIFKKDPDNIAASKRKPAAAAPAAGSKPGGAGLDSQVSGLPHNGEEYADPNGWRNNAKGAIRIIPNSNRTAEVLNKDPNNIAASKLQGLPGSMTGRMGKGKAAIKAPATPAGEPPSAKKTAEEAQSAVVAQIRDLPQTMAPKIPAVTVPPVTDEPPAPAKISQPAPVPQPEVSTKENAFSTFSLNVSDVSFKLAGASLEKGMMPEPATVRSEEFINALNYRDPEPVAGTPLAFASERARYPFAHNRDLLRLSVKTAAAGREPGRPLNLVLLLDNSGSMERADRVRILKESLRVLTAQLQPQDKISIITFSRKPRLWADGVSGDKAAEFTKRVGEITPEGGTDLSAAMDLGYETALKHYQATSVNRVVLLTDGAANLGDVKPEALKEKVEAHRKQGVAFDCFGVGWEGYNDDLLEQLSRNGDGRYGFINTPEAAASEFAGQLAGALRVAASDVKVQVEFNPRRVLAYRQLGYAKHQLKKEQFRDNTVDAAEIGAAESGNALYAIEVNPRGEGDIATVRVRFKKPGTAEYCEHAWTVPFAAPAPALEQSSSSLRLAAAAAAFSEWLVQSPFAAEVTPDRLLGLVNGLPAIYGADQRPAKLEWMIRQAKSISGR